MFAMAVVNIFELLIVLFMSILIASIFDVYLSLPASECWHMKLLDSVVVTLVVCLFVMLWPLVFATLYLGYAVSHKRPHR